MDTNELLRLDECVSAERKITSDLAFYLWPILNRSSISKFPKSCYYSCAFVQSDRSYLTQSGTRNSEVILASVAGVHPMETGPTIFLDGRDTASGWKTLYELPVDVRTRLRSRSTSATLSFSESCANLRNEPLSRINHVPITAATMFMTNPDQSFYAMRVEQGTRRRNVSALVIEIDRQYVMTVTSPARI